MPRVMILGLDGGTFDLIKPWVNEGKLKSMANLLRSGAHGILRSTMPPMTFPAWNSFMTGKNPGKHGLYDFMQRKPGTYDLEIMNAHSRKAETLWNIASRHKKRCAVIGVPVTYPPEEINGIMISGFDTPYLDERIMHPKELFYELKEKTGGYDVAPDFAKHLKAGELRKVVELFFGAIDSRAEAAKYILKKEPWDLFMLVFGETDAALHHFWKYHDTKSPQRGGKWNDRETLDPIYEIYNRVDQKIGELLELAPEDTVVMMMSDHGGGGAGDKVIYVNRFLESRGLLKFKSFPVTACMNRKLDGLKFAVKSRLPRKWFKKLHFGSRGVGLKWEAKLRFSSIDWPRTQVYAEETPYYPNVRINLAGREPDGIVAKEDYRSVVAKTLALLNEWKDPETGAPVVKKAYFREDLYHGDYTDEAPDIVVSWNLDEGYSYLFRSSAMSRSKSPLERISRKKIENRSDDFMLKRSGNHREEGIFLIAGRQIKKGAQIDQAVITALAPTVLHLLGIPLPEDMDGKVIESIFTEDYLKANPVQDGGASSLRNRDKKADDSYS